MTEPIEDITGDVDPFAIEDEPDIDTGADESLTPENALVKELRAYCKTAIAENNSFDVLNLPTNATPEQKVAVFDEMFNYKGIVHHLRQIQTIINNKIKEN